MGDANTPLSAGDVRHLMRRAGFGPQSEASSQWTALRCCRGARSWTSCSTSGPRASSPRGRAANIEESALDSEGNTVYAQGSNDFRSVDFRDVYGTVLRHWLNMPDALISSLLPVDPGDPSLYWTVADFDMPHPMNAGGVFLP